MDESFFKLTSVVSLRKKTQNAVTFDLTDKDNIFAKTVACRFKKY